MEWEGFSMPAATVLPLWHVWVLRNSPDTCIMVRSQLAIPSWEVRRTRDIRIANAVRRWGRRTSGRAERREGRNQSGVIESGPFLAIADPGVDDTLKQWRPPPAASPGLKRRSRPAARSTAQPSRPAQRPSAGIGPAAFAAGPSVVSDAAAGGSTSARDLAQSSDHSAGWEAMTSCSRGTKIVYRYRITAISTTTPAPSRSR